MKKTHLLPLLLLCPVLFSVSCGTSGSAAETAGETAPAPPTEVVFAEKGKDAAFALGFSTSLDKSERDEILLIKKSISARTDAGVTLIDADTPSDEAACEILIGAPKRPEYAAVYDTLKKDEYAIRVVENGEKVKIVLGYNGDYARRCVIDRFIKEYVSSGLLSVPRDLNVTGKCAEKDVLMTAGSVHVRDPFVLVDDDGKMYLYGTGWTVRKNTTGKLTAGWSQPTRCVVDPGDFNGCDWAPEVYKYGGKYYMFTTYLSSKNGHRGCAVFSSASPEGPFRIVSKGHVTPSDWDAIDGTLYVDGDGQPWMVFVHEWTSLPDGIGRMAAMKLSDDLSKAISDPVELFAAKDPKWAKGGITDGPFLYRTESGKLLMLWSNSDASGYSVGVSECKSGKIDGKWTHQDSMLFSKSLTNEFDGGHGMLFTLNGQLYLAVHSPNSVVGNRVESAVFVPVREENGLLVWDIWRG